MGDEDNGRNGKVRRACQNWQILEDEGLAYRLQNKEISEHYDRNRQNNRLVRDDFKAARREQTTEQEMKEFARREEEAEAEELAAQLALLLDEERQEEDVILLDEQLARKLAQEDDEAIAREQQDRELARMLQAKERLKAKKLREARRRKEEVAISATAASEAGSHQNETSEEVVYANLATASNASMGSRVPNHEYATVSQQFQLQPTAKRSETLGQSSIYLLRNEDLLNSDAIPVTSPCNMATSRSLARAAVLDRPSHLNSTRKWERNADVQGNQHRKGGSANSQSHGRFTHMTLEEGEGAIPPYMPMQGLPDRAIPSLGTKPCPSTMPCTNEAAPKKNSSCKTQ